MKDKAFTTEIKHNFSQNHAIVIRTLYMPIIGIVPATVYSLLKDYHQLNKDSRTYDSFVSLLDILQVSSEELKTALKKLEAVGLIRTFIRSDESKYIFVLNEPLSPETFRKNSFLYKQAIAKIGEMTFEKIELSTKQVGLNKDDFMEVTAKYQDIFSISPELEVKSISSTQEIPLLDFKSIDDAMTGLNAFQFIKFLSNENVTPTQQAMVQRIMQLGLSNPSINAIVEYVFNANNKIVSAHIETIANDLSAKGIKGFEDVKNELSSAAKSKKSSVFDVEKTQVYSPVASSDNDENPSWDEIFSSLGGEL